MDQRRVTGTLLHDDAAIGVLRQRPPTFDEIITECVDYYNLPIDRLIIREDRNAAQVRYVIIYLTTQLARPRVTQRDMAQRLNIYRTNVSAAVNKTLGRLEADEMLRDDIDVLRHRIAQAVLDRPCR